MDLTPIYQYLLRRDISARRGGTRLMHLLTAISPWAEVNGLCLDVRALNWQVKQLIIGSAAEHEPAVRAVIEGRVQPHHITVDIGANLGLHTIALSRASEFVHAFEPNPLLLPALRRTVSRLRNVILHEHALGDREGRVSLVADEDHSTAHVVPGSDIAVHRLDDVLQTPVHFIKIDVEGQEVEVLRGAERTLVAYHPLIVFEELPGTDPRARRFLEHLGYACEQIDERDWLASEVRHY